MFTNSARPAWWRLLVSVVVCTAGLAVLACGSSPAGRAATSEPVLHAFVGRFDSQPALQIAVLVGRDAAEAYLCDNHTGGVLLRGTVRQHGPGGTIELNADDGTTINASFGIRDASGTVTMPGQPAARFTAQLAIGSAGLYEASTMVADGRLQGRWIVGNNGQVAGMARLNGRPVGNPALQSTVTFHTATLRPLPVRQLTTTQPLVTTHVPAVSRAILDAGPQIDNAFSWRCGDFHVDGSGYAGVANVQILVNVLTTEVNFLYSPITVTAYPDGTFNADFAYLLDPKPSSKDNNVDVEALEYPGEPYAVPTHASAYMC